MRLISIDMAETLDPRFIHVATIADGSKKYVVLGQIAPTSGDDEHVGKLRFEEIHGKISSGTYIATLHKIEDEEEWMALVKFAATEKVMRMRTESGLTTYISLMTWWENWCYRKGISIDGLTLAGERGELGR